MIFTSAQFHGNLEQFHVLTECSNKNDCLINEMLFIRKLIETISKRANGLGSRKGIHLVEELVIPCYFANS